MGNRTLKHELNDNGAVFFEAAIVIPILLFLLFAGIQYSMLMSAELVLKNAAAAAARVAILGGPSAAADAVTAARKSVSPTLNDAQLVVNVAAVAGLAGAQQVTLSYDYPFMFSFLFPGASGGVVTLRAQAVMR